MHCFLEYVETVVCHLIMGIVRFNNDFFLLLLKRVLAKVCVCLMNSMINLLIFNMYIPHVYYVRN